MNRTLLSLMAATTIAAGVPAVASAQTWMSMNQRHAELEQRIERGLETGQLTGTEAARLRAEFDDLLRLESRYRIGGLSYNERADLDRRYDVLSDRIRYDRRDAERAYGYGNGYEWDNLGQRRARFEQRLNRAVQDRRLTTTQARNLRMEFNRIARLEQQYRRNGLTVAERADIDARMDRLQTTMRAEINANQYGYGYGQAPNLFDYLFGR
jgi:hypothetical protein